MNRVPAKTNKEMSKKLNLDVLDEAPENEIHPMTETEKDVLAQTNPADMGLLDLFDMLITVCKDTQLNPSQLGPYEPFLNRCAELLNVNPVQAMMLVFFVSKTGSSPYVSDMERYFNCSPVLVMRNWKELEGLLRMNYISFVHERQRFRLSRKAELAFRNNCGLPKRVISGLDPEAFMKELNDCFTNYIDSRVSEEEYIYSEIDYLMDQNKHLKVVSEMQKCVSDPTSQIILFYIMKELIYKEKTQTYVRDISNIIEDGDGIISKLSHGRHFLCREGYVELEGDDFMYEYGYIKLTEKAKKVFLSEYDLTDKTESAIYTHPVIKASEIQEKKLFYTPENQKEIDVLADLLTELEFELVCQSLMDNGMRCGFNCLFYGAPGTGKTETAMQLARMTGRDVMQVDISSLRDKYYGETEKIVKQVFDEYRQMNEASKIAPILLFNEADAILSVRTSIGTDNASIDKTENAVQNILLQEMEKLDGIMIATTNLTTNLDKAFERRFIYKVQLEQPTLEARTSIWMSMVKDLNEADACKLAARFTLTGGQIENIARKALVEKVLFQKEVSLERLTEFCEQETLKGSTSRNTLGFVRNGRGG